MTLGTPLGRRALLLAGCALPLPALAARRRAPAPAATEPAPGPAPAAAAPLPPAVPSFVPGPVPRTVLCLYDGQLEPRLILAPIHRRAAMPLEWLGLAPQYHSLTLPLPPVWEDPGCRGVLAWLPEPNLADFAGFVAWAERVTASGRRLVLMGSVGARPGALPDAAVLELRRRLLAAIGLRSLGEWSPVTLEDRVVHAEPGMIGFETPLPNPLPPYELYELGPGARSWLSVERAHPAPRRSHLVATTPRGGFVAPGFVNTLHEATNTWPWRIDPFRFFEAALGAADLPRPDTTTLCGRRIYYSHVDGDGWRSISQVRGPGGERVTAAEVVLRRVVAANPDLPVTIAPIGAELDPARQGDARAIETARALFRLPQVEAATHTDTHPFDWSFFADWSPERERPFLDAYRRLAQGKESWGTLSVLPELRRAAGVSSAYALPRAYGGRGFDLREEVEGSCARVASLLPPGKTVGLLQWSGSCAPFPAAVRHVRAAGLRNINGGDTRFDDEHPSVASVAPQGVWEDGRVQVYASNSNENTYTHLWTARFWGFRDLPVTWTRTGAPRRLKPMNLYYHMYSGDRLASLDALTANIQALRRTEFVAVRASRFAASVEGFYDLRLEREGERAWRVLHRGGLATLRLPGGEATPALDLDACEGVLGARVTNGDLYVALDPVAPAPLVVAAPPGTAPVATRPALVEASWEVAHLRPSEEEDFGAGFAFEAAGFGEGRLRWRLPPAPGAGPPRVSVAAMDAPAGAPPAWTGTAIPEADGTLVLALPAIGVDGVTVRVRRA